MAKRRNASRQCGTLFESLQILGWIRRDGSLAESQALHQTILAHVQQSIQGKLQHETLFYSLQTWNHAVVASRTLPSFSPPLGTMGSRFSGTRCLYPRALGSMVDIMSGRLLLLGTHERIVLYIITDYPESHACVTELGCVLQRTGNTLATGRNIAKESCQTLSSSGSQCKSNY